MMRIIKLINAEDFQLQTDQLHDIHVQIPSTRPHRLLLSQLNKPSQSKDMDAIGDLQKIFS